jgi:hypothetical protein
MLALGIGSNWKQYPTHFDRENTKEEKQGLIKVSPTSQPLSRIPIGIPFARLRDLPIHDTQSNADAESRV